MNHLRFSYIDKGEICCKGTAFFGYMQGKNVKNLHICKICCTFARKIVERCRGFRIKLIL